MKRKKLMSPAHVVAILKSGDRTPVERFASEFAAVERERQQKTGEKLIEVLMLRRKANDRVDTTWGDKTAMGLFLTVKRIIEEGSR